MVRNPPAKQEIQVQSLGGEDSLEKEMATHSTPGKSCGQRSLAGYSPWGHKRVEHDLATEEQQHELLARTGNTPCPSLLSSLL